MLTVLDIHTRNGLILSISRLLLISIGLCIFEKILVVWIPRGLILKDSVRLGIPMQGGIWLHFWQDVDLLVWCKCLGPGHRHRLLNFHILEHASISSWHTGLILILHHISLPASSMYHVFALADVLLERAWAQRK